MATLAARVTALAQAVGADIKALAASVAGKAAKGANKDITSIESLTTPLSIGQGGTGSANAAGARLNIGAVDASMPAMRNAFINGGLFINQRAFAGGALAAGVYGFDRWKAGANGASLSLSGSTITLSSGAIVQVIEADTAAYMAGKSATFSVEDPSATVSVAMAFSATDTTAVSGTIAAGSGRRGVTLALPAGTGNLTVTVSVSASTTFKRLQLELGAVATGWDARPIALEFQLCKRYCFRIQRGSVFAPTAVRGIMIVEYDPMRISPSATATGAVTITDTSNDYTQSSAGIVVSYLSTTGGQIYFDGFSGLTAYRIYIAHGSKGGAVILDAEL